MLEVTSHEVMQLRGYGDRFTELVDSVIRAQAARAGVPDSALHMNLRVSQRDGGVDTQVDVALAGDLTGLFGGPTIWQYKAQGHADISDADLLNEMQRPYAQKMLRAGYAYRLAIADDLPAQKKTAWESLLTAAARRTSKDSPIVCVVAASGIASWVTRFPARVLRFFRPPGPFLHFDAWTRETEKVTRTFVPIAAWDGIEKAIQEHCDFERDQTSPVLLVRGVSGAGKTRLVHAALTRKPGASTLVVYSDSPGIVDNLGYYLANNDALNCILVADESDPTLRWQMHRRFSGCAERVRVIAMDNAAATDSSAWMHEAQLERMDLDALRAVLLANFPGVPPDMVNQYSRVTDGFVRIAADMCVHYGRAGAGDKIPPTIEAYIDGRTTPPAREALLALSLFTVIGYEGDKANELTQLCATLDLGVPSAVRALLLGLKDAPGFVATKGRFLSVTPDIVATVCFVRAWKRWVEANPAEFWGRLPTELQHQFQQRIAQSAAPEVRRVVGSFLRSWVGSLTAVELQKPEVTKRLVTLIDTDPDVHLPLLVRIIESATDEDLLKLSGDSDRGWGPRRHLVWLCERMASLPDYFDSVERVLVRLAANESETGIGNNATRIWSQLFRIYLSGTPVPFEERVRILRARANNADSRIARLAIAAASTALRPYGMRMGNHEFVAGRRVPKEWQPLDAETVRMSVERLVDLLCDVATSERTGTRSEAIAELVKSVRLLLNRGFATKLQHVLKSPLVDDALMPELLDQIQSFLEFDGAERPRNLVEQVEAWKAGLLPHDIHGRLIRFVGQSTRLSGDEDPSLEQELRELASALITDDAAFHRELGWLSTSAARAAGNLGMYIGELDPNLSMLGSIVRAAERGDNTALARGYVFGVCRHSPEDRLRAVEAELDRLQTSAPRIALDLALAGGVAMKPVERTLAMVRAGSLPSAVLGSHVFWNPALLVNDDRERILRTMIDAAPQDSGSGVSEGIALLAAWLHGDANLLAKESLLDVAWTLMELSANYRIGSPWHWDELLRALTDKDLERTIKIAIAAIVGNNYSCTDYAENFLSTLAPRYPDQIMEELGRAMMSDRGWVFLVGKHTSLIRALPLDVVKGWLGRTGVEGAQKIARHLPEPFLGGSDGQTPQVPALTAFVLQQFEDDDQTFQEFMAGFHSMQVYQGNIAEQHQLEAEFARKFASHPLRRIREWARIEEQNALGEVKRWTQYEQERDLD